MLPLVQIQRMLRRRSRSYIREATAFTEAPEEIPVVFRSLRGGFCDVVRGVFSLHTGFPAPSISFPSVVSNNPDKTIKNALSPLALGNHTFDLIQAAIRTWRAVFHNVTANFASSTTTASFRCASLDRTGVNIEASCRGLAFPLSIGGIHGVLHSGGGGGRGGGVSHGGER